MAEENPLRQVQELLADPSNLLDRISRIRSIIGSVEATEAPQQSIQDKKEIPSREVEDLLRMLRDMQMQIDQHVRPLALQAIHIEAERLRELAKQEQVAHDRCLILLDQSLRVCIERIDESRQLQLRLSAINDRLVTLGAPAETLDSFDMALSSTEILQNRIDKLSRQGRF